jgi:hypothetical protein
MEVTTVVNGNIESRSVLSETDDVVVSDVEGGVVIGSLAVEDDVTGSSVSEGNGSTVVAHSTSVTSRPILAIDEIISLSESTPVKPRNERTAISNRGNSAVGTDTVVDTGPSAGALGIADVLLAVDSPHSGSDDSLTVGGNVAGTRTRGLGLRLGLRGRAGTRASGNASNSLATNNVNVRNPTRSTVEVDLGPPVVGDTLSVDHAALLLADGTKGGDTYGSNDGIASRRTRADINSVSPDLNGGSACGQGKSHEEDSNDGKFHLSEVY